MAGMKFTVVLALLILLLPLDFPAGACDCGGPPPLSSAVRRELPFIFEGKAVEIVERVLLTQRTTSAGGSGESQTLGREVVFEVTRAWNGVTTKRMSISSVWSDCMVPFEIDHTYVVFASKDGKGAPVTNSCTRTVESSKAADVLKHLGPATVPK
jgi:hypothetical protein